MTQTERRRFTIRRCLGRGGFGEVYLATMESAGGVRKDVAVKVLTEGVAPGSQALERLRDEGRLLGLLNHPAILTVHDLILLEGRIALVMEYVDGGDLEDCFRGDEPIPVKPLLEVIGQVADALDAAYNNPSPEGGRRLGIVHRDIKPHNIRIGRRGQVKLLDFGIAKASDVDRHAKTRTDTVLGTLPYMAPERFDTDREVESPASDVYALGCVLFEGLSRVQRGMFGELSPSKHISLAVQPAKHDKWVNQHLESLHAPQSVVAALRGMLAIEAEDRPSAAEVAQACEELVARLEGPTLRRWARDRDWGEPPDIDGPLRGRVVTEATLSAAKAEMLGRPADTGRMVPADYLDLVDDSARSTFPLPPERQVAQGAPVTGPTTPIVRKKGGLVLGAGAIGCIALAVVALLVVGGVGGAMWLGLGTSGATDVVAADGDEVELGDDEVLVEDDEGVGDAVADSGEAVADDSEAHVGDATPQTPRPRVDTDGAVADIDTEVAADTDPSADLEVVPPGADGDCGDAEILEKQASKAALPSDVLDCLKKKMRDPDLKPTERQKWGRIRLAHDQALCQGGRGCETYELTQLYYFKELARSDADLLYSWTVYLYAKGTRTLEHTSEVMLWAERALERRTQWSTATFVQRVEQLYEMRAKAGYLRWEIAEKGGDDRRERFRQQARDAAADWLSNRRRLGRDPGEALKLCTSAATSASACEDRTADKAREVVVTFGSVPMGAEVYVDDELVGKTPTTSSLVEGSHRLLIRTSDKEGTKNITVGSGQPIKHIWHLRDGTWTTAF